MDFWSQLFEGIPEESLLEYNGCPSCEQSEARELSRIGPTFLKRCSNCALVYTSPRLAASIRDGMYRQNPGALSTGLNAILDKLMAERAKNMLKEMFPLVKSGKPSNVLFEVGSGWGHFLQACRPYFNHVTGVEFSKEQSAFAREKFGLEISEKDIFKDGLPLKYDVIAAWELLEHLPNPRQFLAWAHSHLLPGGQLILSTPNFSSLYRRILGAHWFYFIPSQHLAYFSPNTLKTLLLDVGFSEIKVYTSGRSLFRERVNDHNQIDTRLDLRNQWLQTLRIRESIELQRDGVALDRGSLLKRIWHGVVWRMVNPLVRHGFGDQLRIYAQRS